MSTRTKTENLSSKISPEHKRLIEQAAHASGFTTSEFIMNALINTASEVLHDKSVIQLTKEQWDRFTTSLEHPAREPDEATRKAVELFKLGRDEGDKQIW